MALQDLPLKNVKGLCRTTCRGCAIHNGGDRHAGLNCGHGCWLFGVPNAKARNDPLSVARLHAIHPDAIVRGELDNHLRVDYSRLGLKLMTLPEWPFAAMARDSEFLDRCRRALARQRIRSRCRLLQCVSPRLAQNVISRQRSNRSLWEA